MPRHVYRLKRKMAQTSRERVLSLSRHQFWFVGGDASRWSFSTSHPWYDFLCGSMNGTRHYTRFFNGVDPKYSITDLAFERGSKEDSQERKGREKWRESRFMVGRLVDSFVTLSNGRGDIQCHGEGSVRSSRRRPGDHLRSRDHWKRLRWQVATGATAPRSILLRSAPISIHGKRIQIS